jgi:hypothetical protein
MKAEMFGPLGSPQYRGYAADIHDSGSHLLTVINDILDLSKIEAGKFELNEEHCDPARLVRDAVRFVAERADSTGLGLQQRLPAALPAVRADGRLIKQILLNLLSNAIKFTPAGGLVTVVAELDAEANLSLTVADTGIGIAADQLERVLQPFTQHADAHPRRHRPGPAAVQVADRIAWGPPRAGQQGRPRHGRDGRPPEGARADGAPGRLGGLILSIVARSRADLYRKGKRDFRCAAYRGLNLWRSARRIG